MNEEYKGDVEQNELEQHAEIHQHVWGDDEKCKCGAPMVHKIKVQEEPKTSDKFGKM
jgi:hypothetical protein